MGYTMHRPGREIFIILLALITTVRHDDESTQYTRPSAQFTRMMMSICLITGNARHEVIKLCKTLEKVCLMYGSENFSLDLPCRLRKY